MSESSSADLPTNNHSGRTRQRHGIAVGEGAIRKIFPVFVLLMWITAGIWIARGDWTGLNWLLAAEAAVICAIVFVNFVHVFNFGYATCLFVLNLTILAATGAPLGALLIGGLLMVYGVRLFTFAFTRYRHPTFAGRRAGIKGAHKALPTPIKVLLFLQTTTLMTFHAMTTYNIATRAEDDGTSGINGFVIAGAAILLIGLLVESIADAQKQRAKHDNPTRWVDSGLFRRTRHPNYLGEILVQAGVIIAGIGAATSWYGYLAGFLAPTYIIILMLSATTGGEKAKFDKHGDDPEFLAYADRSNALLPALARR